MFKRALAWVLAVLMVVSMLPTTAFATTDGAEAVSDGASCVAKIDGSDVEYETVAAAVAAASTGDTVVIYQDVAALPHIDKAITIKGAEGESKIKVASGAGESQFGSVDGTVVIENLSFTDSKEAIRTDHSSYDYSELTVKLLNCDFNAVSGNWAVMGGASWNNHVLHGLWIENCSFTASADASFTPNYMVYAQCVEEVTIKGCTFDGNSNYRGAIHLGDSTDYATVAVIEGNTIKNMCRGVQIGNRKETSSITIDGNVFENLAYSDKDSKAAEECVPVYIHGNADADAIDTFVVTDNQINSCDNAVIYSANADASVTGFVTSFEGNTKDSVAIELEGNYYDSVFVSTEVAQVGDVKYESVLEALEAAIDTNAAEVKILKDSREVMTTDFDIKIAADLTITADAPVSVEFYNDGTTYDFSVGSTNSNTLTIAENVSFDLTDRVIWLGYWGNDVDVVVDGYIGAYQIWHGADTTVNATGTLDSHGEAFIMRSDATLTVDGGNVNANYITAYSGHIVAKNDANVTAGLVWIKNAHDYGVDGTVSVELDNSTFTSNGVFTSEAGTDKTVTIDVKNGSVLTIAGDHSIDAGTVLNVNGSTVKVDGTMTNDGTFNVYSESTLDIATHTSTLKNGNEVILCEGAIIKDSTVGGDGYITGNVTFRGDNTFAMLYDFGDFYSSTTPSMWTVEEGASLTLTDTDRYGLGYGDKVTVYGTLEDALTARDSLTDEDAVLNMYGGLVGMTNSAAPDAKNVLTVKDAYVIFGVEGDKSFGNKSGSSYYGNYEFNFENSVITANGFKFYTDSGKSVLNVTDSDLLVNGVLMTNDADSKFTFTNSVIKSLATSNGTDDKNQNAGELTLIGSSLTYSAPFTNVGTLTLGAGSSLTAPSISGDGTIVIDAEGMSAGPVAAVSGDASGFTGNIEVINNDAFVGKVVDGIIVLESVYAAKNVQTGVRYTTVAQALAEAVSGQRVILLTDTSEDYVMVTPGVILDMNGYELTAEYVVGFKGSSVINGKNNADGKLIVKADHVSLDQTNAYGGYTYMPIYDAENGCYVFTMVSMAAHGFKAENNEYSFIPYMMDYANAYLDEADEIANSGVNVILRLTWEDAEGTYTATQDFTYSDEFVEIVIDSYGADPSNPSNYAEMYYAILSGTEVTLGENVAVSFAVTSESGVEAVSNSISIDF